MNNAAEPKRPLPRKEAHRTTRHGDTVVDNYEWLRAAESPEVNDYLQAQDEYTEQRTRHLSSLREKIFEEIKKHTKEDNQSLPVRRGHFWYYSRTVKGQNYAIHCRLRIADPADRDPAAWLPPRLPEDGSAPEGEEIYFNTEVEAEGHPFYHLGSFDISDDGRLLLYGVDTDGGERYTLRIRSLETGADLPDLIPDSGAGAFFHPDAKSVFYETMNERWRASRVWQHTLGEPLEKDRLLLQEPHEAYSVSAGLSHSRRYLFIFRGGEDTTEGFLLDLLAQDVSLRRSGVCLQEQAPPEEVKHIDPALRLIWPEVPLLRYSVEHAVLPGDENILLILHNREAEDFELGYLPLSENPSDRLGEYHPLVPHRAGRILSYVEVFSDFWVLGVRENGIMQLRLTRLPGADNGSSGRLASGSLSWQHIDLSAGELCATNSSANAEWNPPSLNLSVSCYTQPTRIFNLPVPAAPQPLNLAKTHMVRQAEVPGLRPELYRSQRLWVISDDGTRVPLSLLWREDLVKLDGQHPAPCRLYGYGSYGISMVPGFSVPLLSLLDRGMLLVTSHVRGGGELGESWYQGGKLQRRVRCFEDFIASARALVDRGYTVSDRLIVEGRSAGGMLVGTSTNMTPRLWAGVVAGVPFVDVLTTMLKPELPLTVGEYEQWGNPNEDEDAYRLIKSYSPYNNVAEDASAYPRILATAGLHDPRVSYTEPAKWVSLLQERGADALFHLDKEGHFGSSGRYDAWKNTAWQLAWILEVVGLAEAAGS